MFRAGGVISDKITREISGAAPKSILFMSGNLGASYAANRDKTRYYVARSAIHTGTCLDDVAHIDAQMSGQVAG